MTFKLNSLRVENFRGIRYINLEFGAGNLIVVGENGSGKSSLVDALEYYFTGSVKKLSGRADVNEKKGIPHLKGGPTRVAVTFTGLDEEISVPYPRKAVRAPAQAEAFFKLAQDRPFVLRRSQILEFVNAKPAGRYKKISEIVGLGDLDAIDDQWRRQRKVLEDNLHAIEKRYQLLLEELGSTLRCAVETEDDVVIGINEWLASGELEPIWDLAALGTRLSQLKQRLQRAGDYTKLASLQQLRDEVAALVERLERYLSEQNALQGHLQRFWQQSRTLDDASWELLLNEGFSVLQGEPQIENCPLCEAVIEDRGSLLERLRRRVEALRALTEQRRQIRHTAANLAGRLADLQRRLQRLSAALASNQILVDSSKVEALLNTIAQWEKALQQDQLLDLRSPTWQDDGVVGQFFPFLRSRQEEIEARLTMLSAVASDESLVQLLQTLTLAEEQWGRLKGATACLYKARFLLDQVSLVYDQLITARIRGMDRLRYELEEDFERFYQQLHPGEGYREIAIVPHEDRRSSIDLTARFQEQTPVHPLNYWSEGHLDSLGLCVFLAFIKHFNGDLKLIALDDVLTTVDAGHRIKVARLLAREFAGYQLIITTHDQLWARQLERIIPNSRLLSLKRWSFDQGADYWNDVLDDWTYYEEQARRGRAQDAIAGTGRNLEKFLYQMRSNLGLAVPARPDGNYTIADLYGPFFKWVRDHPLHRPDRPLFQQELALLEEQLDHVWRLRNWAGAHFHDWAATVSAEEAVEFVHLVKALVEAFECPVCRSLVFYNQGVRALICPECRPVPPQTTKWSYDSGWHGRALRMLAIDKPSVEVQLRNMGERIFEYFLQDMRRRVHLALPAREDGNYPVTELYPTLFRWAKQHPHDGQANWPATLQERHTELLAFRNDGQWQVSQEKLAAWIEAVHAFISLFACNRCSQLLSYEDSEQRYLCSDCDGQNVDERTSAYWFVQ